MRNGVPLPERTPQQVVSQLVYRVLGPLRTDRIRSVLDYHGLAGHPAAAPEETARLCCVTVGMLRVRTGTVRAAGAALPLRPALVVAAMRDSVAGEDHLGRVRIARTLRLPAPRKPLPPAAPRAVERVDLRTAHAAVRVLAATGALHPATLLGAVTRYQRFRHRLHPPTTEHYGAALTMPGATWDDQGR